MSPGTQLFMSQEYSNPFGVSSNAPFNVKLGAANQQYLQQYGNPFNLYRQR